MSTQEIKDCFPKLKWIILHNEIYDLTDFNHPGGNFIIENIVGNQNYHFLCYNNCKELLI